MQIKLYKKRIRRMCDFGKCKFDSTAKNNPRKHGYFSDELKWKRNTLTAYFPVVELQGDFFVFLVLFFIFFLSEFSKCSALNVYHYIIRKIDQKCFQEELPKQDRHKATWLHRRVAEGCRMQMTTTDGELKKIFFLL